jgi:tetratricopeptide (TPR) repeat protein
MRVFSGKVNSVICFVQVAALILSPTAIAAEPLNLKPLVPKLDTSRSSTATRKSKSTLPEPSPPPVAPSYGSSEDRHNYNSSTSDSGSSQQSDRVKDLLRQAISQYGSGNAAEAEKSFNLVLKMDRENADAHFSLGAIAESRGDLEGAAGHYRISQRANPADADVQKAVVAVENKLRDRQSTQRRQIEGQKQIAQQERQRAQLKKLSEDAAAAYSSGKYDLAVRNLEQVAQQAPNDPDVQYALAQAYRGKGDFGRAREQIEKAVAQDPNNQMYRSVQSGISQESSGQPAVANDPATNRQPGWTAPIQTADNEPSGQITPIQPDPNSPSRRTEYGYASSAPGFSLGGLSGLGSLLPAVAGMGLGMGMGGGQYRSGGSSTRIKRAVTGSLTGAAAGAAMAAMTNRQPGSIKQGAVRGALWGGMAGLIFGGF